MDGIGHKVYYHYVMPTLLQFLQKNADQVLTFEFGEYAMTCDEYLEQCLTTDDAQDRASLCREVYTMGGGNGTQVYIKMPDATTDSFLATIGAPIDVIFRKLPKGMGGEVIAIFPRLENSGASGGGFECYQHTGQHDECDHEIVYRTKLATPEEYADLKKELEDAPYYYRFRVLKRWPAR